MNRVMESAEPVICVGRQNKGVSGKSLRNGPDSNIISANVHARMLNLILGFQRRVASALIFGLT